MSVGEQKRTSETYEDCGERSSTVPRQHHPDSDDRDEPLDRPDDDDPSRGRCKAASQMVESVKGKAQSERKRGRPQELTPSVLHDLDPSSHHIPVLRMLNTQPYGQPYGIVWFVRKRSQGRLSREDWARAALSAIARGGIGAVAVETIAAQLGATKGSFYWHFKNRQALIEAALQLWEQSRTDAVIEHLAAEPDPARRLRLLLEGGYEHGPTDRVEIALLSNPGHPIAVRTMRRVAARRIAYLADQLEAVGWERHEARDRALLIAYVYVGRLQLAHIARNATDPVGRRRQVDLLFNAFVKHETRARDGLLEGAVTA